MKRTLSFVLACVTLICCAFTLTSCFFGPNSDPEKAKANLEEAGYHAELIDNEIAIALMGIGLDDIEKVVTATNKDDITDSIAIYYFESSEDADEAYEKLQKLQDEDESEDDSDYVLKKFGSMVWVGSKAAAKAAR